MNKRKLTGIRLILNRIKFYFQKIHLLVITFFILIFIFKSSAFAQDGRVITIGSIDDLLWSIVKTIQYYSLPLMAIALVGLGVRLISSGDDSQTKQVVKNWMIKVLTGGVVIFSAATIAGVLKSVVGGG